MKSKHLKIAITGGIGSGKSTISKLLELYNVPVYDSDSNAKHLMETSPFIIAQIINEFGDEAYSDNKLNRAFISQQVFSSTAKLNKINNIVHQAVVEDFNNWIILQDSGMVAFESAIIFENKLEKYFHKTIAVISPKSLRIKRVKQRSELSIKEIIRRIDNQLSNIVLKQLADFVIVNNEKAAIIPQVETILKVI